MDRNHIIICTNCGKRYQFPARLTWPTRCIDCGKYIHEQAEEEIDLAKMAEKILGGNKHGAL